VRLYDHLVRQRSLVLVVAVGLMLAGVVSMRRLGTGIYPEVEFPRIVVVAHAADLPPEEIQAAVVRPLEESLASVLGLRSMRVRIIRGAAEIALQFTDGTDMWRALQLVDAAAADARSNLPSGVEVETQKVTPADFPILSYNLVGGTGTERRDVAEQLVRPVLARVPGVGRVEVVGGDPREIEVVVDPTRLAATGLRPTEMARRVGEGITRRSVGRFDTLRQSATVLAESPTLSASTLPELPVVASRQGSLRLRALADVFEGAPDRVLSVHAPEGDAVQVSISRMLGASAPDVVAGVEAATRTLRLPQGLSMKEVYNQGGLIHDSILGIRDAIGVGILLTVGVLALFLRNARAGFLAALSVPVALVSTFFGMSLFGQTLNLMSLGGMAIAIGLVIDDAIVVVEAIVRRREEGASEAAAVSDGLHEMTSPVIGTTVTTIVVLVPLALLSGLVGSFFSALALTLSVAVFASLLFALLILPLLSRRLGERRAGSESRLDRVHARLLGSAQRHRVLLALTTAALVLLGAFVARRMPSGFLPEMDEGAFVLDYFLPAGTSLADTERAALRMEEILGRTAGVDTWSRRTGAELGPVTATLVSRGDIAVRLLPRGKRREAEEVIADVRTRLETDVPGVRVEFVQILEDVLNDLSGAPRPLEVKLFGPDDKVLRELAGKLNAILADVPNLVDIYSGVEGRVPLRKFTVDAEAAVRMGLTASDVADDLSTALQGRVVGSVPFLDRLVPVRVRFPDAVRFVPESAGSFPISVNGTTLPVSALAPFADTSGASVLYRENLSPVVPASSDVAGGDLGAAARAVASRLGKLPLPQGYRAVIGGRAESQGRAFSDLAQVLGLGILAVFTVLVAQFRSARTALLVLLTVPLALSGGVLSLFAFRVPLNVSSVMGLVLLVGLVVKNGILLVQKAQELMAEGSSAEGALMAAAGRRLRPIMMTTLCTVFGLLPLAFALGAGSELQRPLAVAVVGGLLVSTLATLIALPVLGARFLPGDR
jgi:multidrug efflux pump subunit AcrB